MTKKYDFKTIEKKWQKIWDDKKLFHVEIDNSKPKFYGLIEFPYPSGAGLHVGHPRSFTAMDVISRKRRMQGYNVLFPIGFDAFGLPTERYAIKNHIHPAIATKQNVENFTKQLKMLGYSFDWDRVVNTTDPAYYKWTQWIFIQLFKAGLAYKGEETISWCPECKIGISNEELENGHCERCGSAVVKKKKSAWILKMQSYSDKLLAGLNEVDFPDSVKKMQSDWIGKSTGAEIHFNIAGHKEQLCVYTTRPDTIFGVTYMVISPEHPILETLATQIKNIDEVKAYQAKAAKKSDFERSQLTKEKTGVRLDGISAINPITQKEIPVFISDYVLMGYGTGAIMAVPAHDERDYDFARKFDLPIIQVIEGGDISTEAYTGDGTHINSDFLNGLNKSDAITKMIEKLEATGIGHASTQYKMKDWVFTRQRYWGEPIPMVYCEKCGWVPLDEKDLPLTLPEVDDYMPTDEGLSPLAKATEWLHTTCPHCGGPATRETDTMPTWAGSSWYYLRYMDPHNDKAFASPEALKYWGEVDWYEGGAEHVTRHLLYSRFWHKALYDLGIVPYSEPYHKRSLHGMILAENGEKMSKSKGNVINPNDIVAEYGADTLRIYEMFIGPFDQAAQWSTNSMIGISRFLTRAYELTDKTDTSIQLSEKDLSTMHTAIRDVSTRIEEMKFNTAISALMIYSNYMSVMERIPTTMLRVFIQLLAPFAPHISDEMWEQIGEKSTLEFTTWPSFDEKYLMTSTVNYVISINGKKRAEMEFPKDLAEEEIKSAVLGLDGIKKYFGGKEPKKVIVVPNKLVNIVV